MESHPYSHFHFPKEKDIRYGKGFITYTDCPKVISGLSASISFEIVNYYYYYYYYLYRAFPMRPKALTIKLKNKL